MTACIFSSLSMLKSACLLSLYFGRYTLLQSSANLPRTSKWETTASSSSSGTLRLPSTVCHLTHREIDFACYIMLEQFGLSNMSKSALCRLNSPSGAPCTTHGNHSVKQFLIFGKPLEAARATSLDGGNCTFC